MNVYKWGIKTFHAWSEMPCADCGIPLKPNPIDHKPHAWESEYTIYGPYMCWGHPARRGPDDLTLQDLRDMVADNIRPLLALRPYMRNGSKEANAIDKIATFARGSTP